MKNLFTTLYSKQKKFLVLGLVSLLSLLYIFSQTSPITSKPVANQQENNSAQKLPDQLDVVFSSGFPSNSIPQALPVYEATIQPPNLKDLSQSIAIKLNLTPDKNLPTLWSTPNQSRYLLIDTYTPTATYQVNINDDPEAYKGSNLPRPAKAIAAANSFAQLIFPSPINLQVEEKSLSYLTIGSSEYYAGSAANYSLIKVSLSQNVNNYPVRYAGSRNPYLEVIIGQNNQVVKATISPQPITVGKKVADFPVLNFNQINSYIKNKKAQIIKLDSYPNIDPKIEELSKINIRTTAIEYYMNNSNTALIPYFHFSGQSNSVTNIASQIEILVPAVIYNP